MQQAGYTWQEAEDRVTTVYDYDTALEEHISATREARRYTTGEPFSKLPQIVRTYQD